MTNGHKTLELTLRKKGECHIQAVSSSQGQIKVQVISTLLARSQVITSMNELPIIN